MCYNTKHLLVLVVRMKDKYCLDNAFSCPIHFQEQFSFNALTFSISSVNTFPVELISVLFQKLIII